MLPSELALRTGTAALLLLTGVIMLRDRWRMELGPFGGLLALSVAADVIVSVAGAPSLLWLWPLRLAAMGAPAMLWIRVERASSMTSTPHGAMSWLGRAARCWSVWLFRMAPLDRDIGRRAGAGVHSPGAARVRRIARRSCGAPSPFTARTGNRCRLIRRRRSPHAHAQPWSAHGRLKPDRRGRRAGGAYGGVRAACAPRGASSFCATDWRIRWIRSERDSRTRPPRSMLRKRRS